MVRSRRTMTCYQRRRPICLLISAGIELEPTLSRRPPAPSAQYHTRRIAPRPFASPSSPGRGRPLSRQSDHPRRRPAARHPRRHRPNAAAREIRSAKFHHPVRPGDTLTINVDGGRRAAMSGFPPRSRDPAGRRCPACCVRRRRESPSAARRREEWATRRERGAVPLIRAMVWITLRVGRPAARLLLYPACGVFLPVLPPGAAGVAALAEPGARPSGDGGRCRRHFFTFAACVLDRVLLLNDRMDLFHIGIHGEGVLTRIANVTAAVFVRRASGQFRGDARRRSRSGPPPGQPGDV